MKKNTVLTMIVIGDCTLFFKHVKFIMVKKNNFIFTKKKNSSLLLKLRKIKTFCNS